MMTYTARSVKGYKMGTKLYHSQALDLAVSSIVSSHHLFLGLSQ